MNDVGSDGNEMRPPVNGEPEPSSFVQDQEMEEGEKFFFVL